MSREIVSQPNIGTQIGSTGLEKGRMLGAGALTLVSLLGTNNGPDQFIQIHDASAEPANGAVPLFFFPVPSGEPFSLDTPVKAGTGLYVCNSTTPATKTAGGANCFFVGRFV